MNRRALVAAAAGALLTTRASAGCLIFCADEETPSPEDARRRIEAELGRPLPEGVTLTHMLVGGFQDEFVQVRFSASTSGRDALLKLLGVRPTALEPPSGRTMTIAEEPWWDLATRPGLLFAPARLGHYAEASVAAAPDGDGWLIYLMAFET